MTDQFEIYLTSNASMDIFKNNTLASFSNILPEAYSLNGQWQVAVTEITTSGLIENVTETKVKRHTEVWEDDKFTGCKGSTFEIDRGSIKTLRSS